MSQFLKLCSVSQPGFSPAYKIFPVIKKDAKLLFLRFSTLIKQHVIQQEKKVKPPNKEKIILYEYNNNRYFNKIKFYTLSNVVIWTAVAYNIYDIIVMDPTKLNDGSKQKWDDITGNRKLAKKLIFLSVILGVFSVIAIGFYILRSVKQIELIKSTKMVKFQTYSFFPSVREFSVPLTDVSGVISRHSAKTHLPIKVKDTFFYFLLDLKGHFPDAFLFDNSVGVHRHFKKSKWFMN